LAQFSLYTTQQGHFHIALVERLGGTLGDYMDTWKMTHFNEFSFCEFVLPSGPFQGNEWEQQSSGEKAIRKYSSSMKL
jgi:hypothetical protein